MAPLTKQRLRRAAALALVVGLIVGVALRCSPADTSSEGPGEGLGIGATRDGSTFTIEGSTSRPISPGTSAAMNLVITNGNSHSVALSELRVRIGAIRAPRADADHPCGRDDFAIQQSPTALGATVAAHAESSLLDLGVRLSDWPRVGMVETTLNQDGCKGALVDLTFHVKGTQVGP